MKEFKGTITFEIQTSQFQKESSLELFLQQVIDDLNGTEFVVSTIVNAKETKD